MPKAKLKMFSTRLPAKLIKRVKVEAARHDLLLEEHVRRLIEASLKSGAWMEERPRTAKGGA